MSKSRRSPLSPERVLQAAIALADAKGTEHVTMRKVGAKLRVEAMSLYRHVANKEELLGGMVDAVFAEVTVPTDAPDWRSAMRERAHSLRAALKRHPWATPLLDSRAQPGPRTLAHHDAVLACLRAAGFSWSLTGQAFSSLDSYIYGFALQEEALPTAPDVDDVELAEQMLSALPEDRYPALAAFVREHVIPHGFDRDEAFEGGLELLLDGLERRRLELS